MPYHFADTLTEADCKRYIHHTFTVAPSWAGLDIQFDYTPVRVPPYQNLLCLTLLGPSGEFRGAGHRGGAPQSVHLDADRATPGYLPGSLPAGVWTVEIDSHMVLSGQPLHYTLDIAETLATGTEDIRPPAPAMTAPAAAAAPPATREAGWYRGDLHNHTIHSDGDFTVDGLLAAGESRGLDFLTLSDHNTVSALAEFTGRPSPLLRLPALELTTFWGHALCLGARQWIDWRVLRDTDDMAHLAQRVTDAGALFVIAHPRAEGDPGCTGCAWLYGDVWPGPARFIEVWNGPWDGNSGNEENLALWYQWLNEGRRIIATAGTDSHGPHDDAHALGYNVVYAETFSEAGVLDAIRRGHLYLSGGPTLELTASGTDGATVMIGDVVPGTAVSAHAAWDGCPPGAALRLVVNGAVSETWQAGAGGSHTWTLDARRDHWCCLELRGPTGEMLAVTNPVFLGTPAIAQ